MVQIRNLIKSKKFAYILMGILVFIWGFEYVAAKAALNNIDALNLVFYKYLVASLLLGVVRFIQRRKAFLKKKHIITLILCSVFGEVLYFYSEYTAMDYIPVSIISVILAFVPMLSIILEGIVYKRKPNLLIVVGILVCIVGVAMVIGVDIGEIMSGKWIGYVFAFGAVLFWNMYNFLTENLTNEYEPYDLTFMQLCCTVLLTLPYAIFNIPEASQINMEVIGGVLYLSVISACIGFIIYVFGLSMLGPTPCALFSNFLPITTAMFGWIFLGETLTLFQMFGGVVVISSGIVVIWQKGKLDGKRERLEG